MTIHIGPAEGIYFALLAITIAMDAIHHGKPRENRNIWISLVDETCLLALLYWGGFFS